MRYISTRDNHPPVEGATAIRLGMVPRGGLFVPEVLPGVDVHRMTGMGYREVAHQILAALLEDFTRDEISDCIKRAYNPSTFDVDSIIELVPLTSRKAVMELWHGPTAAFKDVALQILPPFLSKAKARAGDTSHTVILVATSGDTGKAALEGFKNANGISIIVFYPEGGVSEIQRIQMATTEGSNTHVVAVRGNFDDCQTGVKQLFADRRLGERLSRGGFVLSSANSINWGRLCPQIVYYFHAYLMLLESGRISSGEEIDFCVPTGNFGNILAGFYARSMGLPVGRLICASNRNKVLTDFFETGAYDRNREFHRTMSPSMDILISSNLERFLFEMTGHDASRIRMWYESLTRSGGFSVDEVTREAMREVVVPGWVDEPRVLAAIRHLHRNFEYLIDTHTAVAVAVSEEVDPGGRYTVIDSTASPYKFSRDVLRAITGETVEDEFASIERLEELSGWPVHRAVSGLRAKTVRHDRVIDIDAMESAVLDIIEGIRSDAPG
jgi:threonine synthase